ncbi:MAG: hypothetical protein Q9172_003106 [Xanthocarpia lactea]
MYSKSLAFLALIGIGFARPAENHLSQPGPSPLDLPSGGFPAEYLPIQVGPPSRSRTQDSSGNLTLPFVPGQHPEFSPRITYIYSNRPRGFELASSITTSIYHYWKDTANEQINRLIRSRHPPLPNFLHTVQPSSNPGAVLNPVKVGLGYCFLLQGVVEKTPASWPGHMVVRMVDSLGVPRRKMEIGVIRVDNMPEDAAYSHPTVSNIVNTTGFAEAAPLAGGLPAATTSISNPKDSKPSDIAINDRNELSRPILIEKRWLSCFTKVLFYFTRHSPSDKFTDDPHHTPQSKPVVYYWRCGHGIDELTLMVFPAASRRGGSAVLTWDGLVRGMLDWVTKAALEPEGHIHHEDVFDHGVKMAILKIRLDRDGGARSSGVEIS